LNERITVIHLSEPQASIIPDGLTTISSDKVSGLY
jgi:hypothetical protein